MASGRSITACGSQPSAVSQAPRTSAAVARSGSPGERQRDDDRDVAERHPEVVCDVAQVVAEAAADREREQLAAVEAETPAARAALGAVDDDDMAAGPAGRGVGAAHRGELDPGGGGAHTSTAPLASIASAVEPSASSISLCALPLGIIGKQFSCFSTMQSKMTGPG